MSGNDQYALNWSNHTTHIKKAFDNLFQDNEFVDVTISCGGRKIKAHRMVLSACSVYFHDLLRENPCPHPIIILRDIEFQNIESIIQFMYSGEVQVPTENFGTFLKTAELLQVSGLTGETKTKEVTKPATEESEVSEEEKPIKYKPSPASKKLERQRKFLESKKRASVNNGDDDHAKQKKRKERIEPKEIVQKTNDLVKIDDNLEEIEEDMTQIGEMTLLEPLSSQKFGNVHELLNDESYLTKESNPECECPVCAQKFSTIYLLKQHVVYHLGETKCQLCGAVFNRKDLLRKHQTSVHKISPNQFRKDV